MVNNVNIVIRLEGIAQIDINKQSMVVQNHDVVHYIYIFIAIELCSMFWVFPWLLDLNKCPINTMRKSYMLQLVYLVVI
jgi:hypothetical protein